MTNRILRLAVVLSLATLASCGGGGGAPGGGGGGTDSRSVLFAEISAKLATFTGDDRDAENDQMLAFLRTKPELVESGKDDSGAVWAYFADGSEIIVGNNLRVENPTGFNRSALLGRPTTRARSRSGGIPDSRNAYVGANLGPLYDRYTDGLRDMLETHHYRLVPDATTVESLKNMSDVSVLYLLGHGATTPVRGNPILRNFAVWTSTVRTPALDAAYAADLKDGSLTWFWGKAYTGDETTPGTKIECHYALTEKFVKKYWAGKFHKNSLVVMNSCNSSNSLAPGFKFAVLQAGASVYLGWTERVMLLDGVLSAAYLFDRLLGVNKENPINTDFDDLRELVGATKEDPPQRAFSIGAVYAEMTTRKRPGFAYNFDTTVNPNIKKGGPDVTGKLEMVTLGGEFVQLAPQIERLAIVEQKDELLVLGMFGDKPGKVLLGSNELAVKEWTKTKITCTIGRDESGTVAVQLSTGQKSNPVQLTLWKGTAKATLEGDGSLKMVISFKVQFRGDIHTYRIQPHTAPLAFLTNYEHSLTTTATYEFSGSYVSPDGLYYEDWSGNGTLPAYVKPPEGAPAPTTYILYQGSISDKREWSFNVLAFLSKLRKVHAIQKDSDGKIVYDRRTNEDSGFESVGDFHGKLYVGAVDANSGIPGGRIENIIDSDNSLSLEWTTMLATSPPDPKAARIAKLR